MGLSEAQIQRMARNVIEGLDKGNVASFISKKEVVISKAQEIISNNFKAEKNIDIETNALVDQLITNSGDKSLNRHKLFKMTKERLAKQKGFVL